MTIQFDTSELSDLAADLAAAGPKAQRASIERLDKIATQFRDDAKADVAVDTGETRDSIHVEGSDDERTIIADSRAAFYLEFGTGDTAPQPYMWPQVPSATKRLTEALEDAGNPFD